MYLNKIVTLVLVNLHAVFMIYSSSSFTLRQVLSIILNKNGNWFKMYFISLTTCNWNDITSVKSHWLTDSILLSKSQKLKVKTAEEFTLYLKNRVQFYSIN